MKPTWYTQYSSRVFPMCTKRLTMVCEISKCDKTNKLPFLISNQVPRRGDKTRCQEVSIISKSRLKAFKNIPNDWSCVNAVSSLALAGNFKFRVAGLFAPSLSCSSVCPRRIRVWRICLGEERSGAERIGALRFRASVRVFCPADITMVCFPFAIVLWFRVLVSQVCILLINCGIVGSTISRFRCLILLFVCTHRAFLCSFVCFFYFVCFGCGDNGCSIVCEAAS